MSSPSHLSWKATREVTIFNNVTWCQTDAATHVQSRVYVFIYLFIYLFIYMYIYIYLYIYILYCHMSYVIYQIPYIILSYITLLNIVWYYHISYIIYQRFQGTLLASFCSGHRSSPVPPVFARRISWWSMAKKSWVLTGFNGI